MSEPDSQIKEHWRSLEYTDARSYTQMPYPKWVADLGQNWFRDSTVAVLRHRTRRRHPFRRVVDLGCGVGDWTRSYLAFAERAVGVDLNESFIAQARRETATAGLGERVEFHTHDIATWHDFDDAGLVTIGAVLAYLSASENDELIDRISQAQSSGDFLYVRATVLNPGHREFTTSGGHYRDKSFYRRRFGRHGYEPVFEAYSTSLAISGPAVRVGVPHGLARGATLGINAAVMGVRFVRRDLDYYNWLLRRR